MAGIRAIAGYVPYHRFERRLWCDAWNLKEFADMMIGERTVADFDEDTVTMAVEAGLDALRGVAAREVDGVFFASTTAPYCEKSSSSLVAAVCDLGLAARTADFANSLRGGTQALLAAADAVKAGSARNVLVTAADMRQCEPKHYMETMMGDCSAAAIVGSEDLLFEIEASAAISREFTDVWRLKDETYLHFDDEKFSSAYGYLALVPQAIKMLLEKAKLAPAAVAKFVAYAPEGASYMALAKRSGFPMQWNQDPLLMQVGNAGCASPLIQLAHLLGDLNPGDRVVIAGYGDGADAILLKTTEKINAVKDRPGLRRFLDARKPLDSYVRMLRYRGSILGNRKSLWDFEPWTSIAMLKKDEKQVLSLYGMKCACGAVFYPIRRVCPHCLEKDKSSPLKLSRRGKLFSFVGDKVFPNPELPTIMGVIDLEGGGRIATQMTDCDLDQVEMGMEVELTFRKFHEGKGFINYFWKARPVR